MSSPEREIALTELSDRISATTGIQFSGRNLEKEPSVNDMPCALIYELGDKIVSTTMRGGYPAYKRELAVIVEIFISGSSEGAASKELSAFVTEVKKKIFEGGTNMGRKCSEIVETEASQIYRPSIGGNAIGMGIAFDIKYIENVQNLF